MTTISRSLYGSIVVALAIAVIAAPEADAKGGRGGGHGGGGGGRAPHVSAAHRAMQMPTFKPPKMPRMTAPARGNASRGNANAVRANTAQTHTKTPQTHANRAATTGSSNTTTTRNTTARGGHTKAMTTAATSPYNYTYGVGSGARRYRAYGYGRGYRNRYYGNRYGYGRSQGYNRAIVARLRSAHATLARIDHDYQGHRVRAMHQTAMAIRQLTHRSMVYRGMGFGQNMNNALAMGMGVGLRRGGARQGLGAGVRRNPHMTQAQSDARMSQAMRNLQGANMQLTSQGTPTAGHARARGHVQQAIRELNVALAIR
jgi:hypothetical protein